MRKLQFLPIVVISSIFAPNICFFDVLATFLVVVVP